MRFIAYPEPWTGALADWQSKASALMRQAQNDPSIKYIVTYGHRPAYSTGYHPGETQIAGILDGFGDSYSKYVLNINGHSHDYERFQPIHGVTHVTVGAPSSLEVPWTSTDPRTAFRAMHLSHLRVDVGATGLRLQAICDDVRQQGGHHLQRRQRASTSTPSAPRRPCQAATDFYVDKTSRPAPTPGPATQATPFCTITKGVTPAACRATTLYVGDGTYAETVKPTVLRHGQRTRSRSPAGPGVTRSIGQGDDQRRLHLRAELHHAVQPHLHRHHRRRRSTCPRATTSTLSRQHGHQRRSAGVGS